MSFTRNWSDGTPGGTEQASDLDTFIQNVRGDISDRIKNMVYGFVAGENTLSQHFQYLQFYEQASVAQPSAGYGRLYTKAVGGKCELFWQDEDGDEIQLTTGGNFGGGNLELLAGMDLLGSATSDITINTNKFTVAGATGNTLVAGTFESTGVATLADASLLKTSAAPTTDAMMANKKYVDDNAAATKYSINPMTGASDSTGTITFPNGLILKWGVTGSVGGNVTATVTFAAAFPNACFQAVASLGSSQQAEALTIHTVTATSFKIFNFGGNTVIFRWFAVGR